MELQFYKNGSKYTAVLPDYYFVQLTERKTVRTISLGRNILICEDAISFDEPITEHEFYYHFEEHCAETQKYIKMISTIRDGL